MSSKIIKIELIKDFNLLIKSFSLNKELIWKKERRLILTNLIKLKLLNKKVDTDTLISTLYKIKNKLIRKFEKQSNNNTKKSKNKKITKKIVKLDEKETINNSKKFTEITLIENNKQITFHLPDKKKYTKNIFLKKSNKDNIKIEENYIPSKNVKISKNYKKWDLLEYITSSKINFLFTEINKINI